jgi:hypothetical protein
LKPGGKCHAVQVNFIQSSLMQGLPARNRGPIWGEFTRAQNGQAISNLARAFHLPRAQAKAAILSMLGAITQRVDEQTLSRGTLARLIELLGKNDYEQVLETPTLMGATSTQVIGNDALTALAGHEESGRIASRAATTAGISEMVAEYLLPVVAAMFMGALSAKTRADLYVLIRGPGTDAEPPAEPAAPAPQFPVGRGSSGFFSGTGVVTAVGADPGREAMYQEFAQRVRLGGQAQGEADPLSAARRVMADGLGVRARHAPWFARLQRWGATALQSASTQTQERLRSLRSRPRDKG